MSRPPDQQLDSPSQPNSGLIDQWVREHGLAMLKEARNWSGNSVTAEDIVQEALYVAYRRARHLKDADKTRNWLVGIVKNLGRQHARKRGRRASLLKENQVDVETCLMPETETDSRREEVLTLADSLPPRQREIIRLVVLEQMRSSEIAERLKTTRSRAAVRQSRRKAIRRLKALVRRMAD